MPQNWFQSALALFRRSPRPVTDSQSQTKQRGMSLSAATLPRNATRVSMDDPHGSIFGSAVSLFEAFSADDFWRNGKLDVEAHKKINTSKLIEVLADISPEISRALWDFLRMCNPGWEITVTKPRGKTVYREAQQKVDDFLKLLEKHYGATDIPINRLFMNLFLRGGAAAEIVLAEDASTPVDLVTPDSATMSWEKMNVVPRGDVWIVGQWQGGRFVRLDIPTFSYVPLDPLPGKPYGRSVVASAVFVTMFLLAVLHDLRRVVMQQGYPRIDVEIMLERIVAAMPDDVKADPSIQKQWIDKTVQQVSDAYAALEPDDAYVHTDVVKINRPVGTVDTSSLGAIDGLLKALERFLIRALKTMPLLLGATEGTSEANANRQWEIHAAGIKSVQHLIETQMSNLLTVMLQAQGIQATVTMRFAELRAAEMMRDAQTDALKIKNARDKYEAGWISQDQAAKEGAGVDKADAEAPRSHSVPSGDDLENLNPEPGANRIRLVQ